MPINKTQKEYLERRLHDLTYEKINKLVLRTMLTNEEKCELINTGKVKLKKDIKRVDYSYCIEDIFDFSKYTKDFDKNNKTIEKLKRKLGEEASLIMDKVILEGTSLEDALKSFMAIK